MKTMSNLTVDYMEMQSKNKTSKNSTAALIYFIKKSDIEKNFNQKYRYMNAKYLILPFLFYHRYRLHKKRILLLIKSGSSFR
jgi:hypothetical protein